MLLSLPQTVCPHVMVSGPLGPVVEHEQPPSALPVAQPYPCKAQLPAMLQTWVLPSDPQTDCPHATVSGPLVAVVEHEQPASPLGFTVTQPLASRLQLLELHKYVL